MYKQVYTDQCVYNYFHIKNVVNVILFNSHWRKQPNLFWTEFFFLDLLKEVESRLLSKSQVSDSMSKQTRLPTKLPPKEDKTKNNMSKGKEPISPKTPMQS